ncbi:MAG TPA: hypothetical protein VIV12_21640, partial [Streptosporangiaceae bacterium]
ALGRMAVLALPPPVALTPAVAFLAAPAAAFVAPGRPVRVAVLVVVLAVVPVALDALAEAPVRPAPAAVPRVAPVSRATPPARVAPVVRVALAVVDFPPDRVLAVVARLAVLAIEVFSLPAPFDAATGFATDMVLAAAVSALEALLMALVAAFIACRAVDMVLADEVALVAALVILVAAEVTFAAAEDTVRAAAA